MAAAVWMWTRYVVEYLENENVFGKILYHAGRTFFFLEVIAVIVNCFYPIMFWFDESGGYHAGSVRYATLSIQILLFLLTSGYTLNVSSKSKGQIKRRHQTISLFGVAMVILIALQIGYPLLPFYAMGYMLGTCVLHVFVVEDEKDEYRNNLKEALIVAEEANKAKTVFLSNMSHEIRTPMNAIIGLDSLALRNESIPEETREYLEKIDGSARHLLGLINDILDMSRIESGRLVLRKEEFSFSSMLEQINTMVMTQCEEKGLHYECNLFGGVSDYYLGDDMKLKQVLINILSNAIKFTDSPGSIYMTVERTAVYGDHSTLKFVVKDTGIGMDETFIPKIFDAFTQEDGSRSSKYGSTGLGMAITKNIVELMNGTISVESEKGVGTEITVTVTLNNSENQGSVTNYIDPRDMRILVVDDEEIAAEHARIVLDEVGIKADTCLDGQTALHMLEIQHMKQEPYNLVLLDWKMPGMDGIEVAKEIRGRYDNETTVIILTSFNWDEIMDEAMHVGVDSFLAKPLFASNVIDEFERAARKNSMSIYKDRVRAELKGRHILMAEDVMINAEIMKQIITMREAEIDHAENGRIVLEMFEKSPVDYYDAILMDVRMPEMDGLEATMAIRALDRPDALTIPIVALTANAFDEDVQRSLQAGMNAHLTKPVDPEHLYQTLEELIGEKL
ncbi:MAG: response regulator [Firmicutes bacterium]|nr:response regulator [Bacillota bacterium]